MSSLLGRFLDGRGRPRLGMKMGDSVQPVIGSLFEVPQPDGEALPLSSVRLLPPLLPSKVVGIGSNYRKHVEEMGRQIPSVPKIFLKPSTSVIGPLDAIQLPPDTLRVDHEAELGVVIGRRAQRVDRTDALSYVLGYTCVNDVTARDFQKADGTFSRGKGFDSFCPLGPWILATRSDAPRRVRCYVDGALRQDGSTDDLIFDIPTLISFVSHVMTLLPGDVIATGTPAGVSQLRHGSTVEVEVEGIGKLRNPVVNREDRQPDGH
jgi:2-keto-4-pentenoate hydratase/2-oxohepta-3-ene-1,7-dioic acid hydratase in catechol pathway